MIPDIDPGFDPWIWFFRNQDFWLELVITIAKIATTPTQKHVWQWIRASEEGCVKGNRCLSSREEVGSLTVGRLYLYQNQTSDALFLYSFMYTDV